MLATGVLRCSPPGSISCFVMVVMVVVRAPKSRSATPGECAEFAEEDPERYLCPPRRLRSPRNRLGGSGMCRKCVYYLRTFGALGGAQGYPDQSEPNPVFQILPRAAQEAPRKARDSPGDHGAPMPPRKPQAILGHPRDCSGTAQGLPGTAHADHPQQSTIPVSCTKVLDAPQGLKDAVGC
jgi:hypothetical protein